MKQAKPVAQTKVPTTIKPKKLSRTEPDSIQDVAIAVTQRVDGNKLSFDSALPEARTQIADGLQKLTACVAMKGLEPIQVRELFDYSKGVEDAVKEASGFARARILDLALRLGEASGATGESRKLIYPDGRYTLAKAQKTGIDPKKFEAALRAKQIDVTRYMVAEVKYKLPSDYDGPKQAIDDGIFTADEVEQMAHEMSYAVERSKEGKGDW